MKTVVAEVTELSSTVSLTGEIKARSQSDLAFRFAGRVASRLAEVGQRVSAGQVLATLDTTQQDAGIAAAKAGVQAAQANVAQTTSTFERQRSLLQSGYTTQARYDEAERALVAAQSALTSAKANLDTATDQLNNAALRAPAAGVITARLGEVGQVVDAAQPVYTFAADGDRDAVFDVSESLVTGKPPSDGIEVSLLSNPNVKTIGKVREVAPAIDPATGTIKVKIGLERTPPEMGLGAPVVGVGRLRPRELVALPWTAFFVDNGKPAVWVVDPQAATVSLRAVAVDSYRTGSMVLRGGLRSGDVVVVAGGQRLHPGERVEAQATGAAP